ncbi:MAG TPA: ATP-binding protein [Caldilineaceae bacterium]|nr:ATP-binding protein [Caldilineaceae bacterium]
MADVYSLSIPADKRELPAVRAFIEQHVRPLTADRTPVYDLLIAVHELVTNAIVHGYQGRPGAIEITLWTSDDALVVRLRDQAPPFDPTQVAPPDTTAPPDQRSPGGLGIQMARRFIDKLSYRRVPQGGNELTLVKHGIIAGSQGGGDPQAAGSEGRSCPIQPTGGPDDGDRGKP